MGFTTSWKFPLAAFAICAAIAAAVPDGAWAQERPGAAGRGGRVTQVVTDEVTVIPMSQTVSVIGRVVARRSGDIAARVGGAVGDIRVEVGDRVQKGDVLATLFDEILTARRDTVAAEVAEFRAKVETARTQLGLARQELNRIRQLQRSAAFSKAQLDDKTLDVARQQSLVAEAEAKLRQTQAELRIADIDLANATIRAPFNGVVIQRHTEIGAFLTVGAKVVTLLNDTEMEVEAEVPSVRLAGLAVGTEISGVLENSRRAFSAKVRAIVPQEDPLARTRTVRLTPDFGQEPVKTASNQSVLLNVPFGARRDVVSVHKDAVLLRAGRTVVFVVTDDVARPRPVTLGDAVGSRFEVVHGLKPGEAVVIRGNERLRPGQPVRHNGSS